jgi:hypothetical protein
LFRSLCAALIVGVAASLTVVPAIPAPIVAGFERFGRHAKDAPGKIEAGLLMLGEVGCVNCHAAGAGAGRHLNAKSGPLLDSVGERVDPGRVRRAVAVWPLVVPVRVCWGFRVF